MGVDAVGEGADGLAQGAFGAGDDLVGEGVDALQPELVHHRQQRAAADVVAGGLGVEVADCLVREADVGADDFQQLVVRLAAGEEFRHGDAQALLENLVRFAGEDLAADVGGVAEVAEVGDDLAVAEDRGEDGEVVELAGGHPGVVGDEDVAVGQGVWRVGGEEMANAGGHGVDVAGGAGQRLGHHLAAGVEDAAGQVLRFAHDGAEGGAHQGRLLLVGNGEEAVPEDLEGDGVERRGVCRRGCRVSRHLLPLSPPRRSFQSSCAAFCSQRTVSF